MKAFGLNSVKIIGRGCTRQVYLMENNQVCKISSDDYDMAGGPSMCIVDSLMVEFAHLTAVKRMERFLSKDGFLGGGSLGIFAEYLLSQKFKEDKAIGSMLALCLDVEVDMNKEEDIIVRGLYENAIEKYNIKEEDVFDVARRECMEEEEELLITKDILLTDLHEENYIGSVIYDYACVRRG